MMFSWLKGLNTLLSEIPCTTRRLHSMQYAYLKKKKKPLSGKYVDNIGRKTRLIKFAKIHSLL